MTADELPVIYRDEQLVAVHKPSGLLVHRSALDPRETRFAVQLLRSQLGQRVFPAHRLDKAASGALLFALDAATAAGLGELVRRHELARTYLAIVRGDTADAGSIDHPLDLRRDPAELGPAARPRGAAQPRQGRPAVTRFLRLARVELPHRVDRYPTSRYSLLQLEPVTGRRHQLRRHLAHVSHPIVGDTTYGKARHDKLFTRLFGSRRLLLAAVELRLTHPRRGEPLVITAPLAAEFAAVIDALGLTGAVPPRWLPRRGL